MSQHFACVGCYSEFKAVQLSWVGSRHPGDGILSFSPAPTTLVESIPYLYGLAAAGEAGVDQVLSQFDSELRRELALTGCTSVSDVDSSLVRTIRVIGAAEEGFLVRFIASAVVMNVVMN